MRFAEIISNIRVDRERIELTRALLAMVAEKGARDLLMGFGLLRNSIAIDARVMKVGLTQLRKPSKPSVSARG